MSTSRSTRMAGVNVRDRTLNYYKGAVEMYSSGASIAKVAAFFGKSRQQMHEVLKEMECRFRPMRRSGADNHFYRGGSRHHKYSSQAVERAIRSGSLKESSCEVCGEWRIRSDGQRDIVAHHDDYNKPLDVRWLCKVHHAEWHRTHKAIPWARSRYRRPSRSGR